MKRCIIFVIAICFILHITGVGCPIRFFTGVSCGGCGMTRAVISLMTLNIKQAFDFHPLVFIVPVYAVVWAMRKRIKKRIFNIITLTVVLLFVGVYIIRLIDPTDAVVTVDIKNGFIFKFTKDVLEVFFNG